MWYIQSDQSILSRLCLHAGHTILPTPLQNFCTFSERLLTCMREALTSRHDGEHESYSDIVRNSQHACRNARRVRGGGGGGGTSGGGRLKVGDCNFGGVSQLLLQRRNLQRGPRAKLKLLLAFPPLNLPTDESQQQDTYVRTLVRSCIAMLQVYISCLSSRQQHCAEQKRLHSLLQQDKSDMADIFTNVSVYFRTDSWVTKICTASHMVEGGTELRQLPVRPGCYALATAQPLQGGRAHLKHKLACPNYVGAQLRHTCA